MIDSKHFSDLILQPVLSKLQSYSSSMENLLYMTALAETSIGSELTTATGFGIFGMTMDNHQKVWNKFLINDGKFINILMMEFNINPSNDLFFRLTYDLWYSTAMAYFQYRSQQNGMDTLALERGTPEDLADIYNSIYAEKKLTKKQLEKLIERYNAYKILA